MITPGACKETQREKRRRLSALYSRVYVLSRMYIFSMCFCAYDGLKILSRWCLISAVQVDECVCYHSETFHKAPLI